MGSSPFSTAISSLRNFTRMKGSTLPPHDFLLYMPEHCWRFSSVSSCPNQQGSRTRIQATSYKLDFDGVGK